MTGDWAMFAAGVAIWSAVLILAYRIFRDGGDKGGKCE